MQQQLQDPMLAYPPQVYYSSSPPLGAFQFHPPAANPSAAHLPPSSQLDPPDNCCDICCPGCSGCCPSLGNCHNCDPCCIPCCLGQPGCAPGGCCSATGCSPTRCSPWVGVWSVPLCLKWVSFVFMLAAVTPMVWFQYGGGYTARVGLWKICSTYYMTCGGLSYSLLLQMVDLDLFQSLRAFTIVSVMLTLTSAILASVRLARHQRGQAPSKRFDWSMLAVGVSSVVCLLLSVTLGCVALRSITIPYQYSRYYSTGSSNPGPGLILVITAFALQVIAVPMQAVTTCLQRRASGSLNIGLSGVEGAPAAQMEQPYQPNNNAAAHSWWSSGSGSSAATAAPAAPAGYASSFSHPSFSPYQPPGHYMPRAAEYQSHVPMGAMPAAPVPMAVAPQW